MGSPPKAGDGPQGVWGREKAGEVKGDEGEMKGR